MTPEQQRAFAEYQRGLLAMLTQEEATKLIIAALRDVEPDRYVSSEMLEGLAKELHERFVMLANDEAFFLSLSGMPGAKSRTIAIEQHAARFAFRLAKQFVEGDYTLTTVNAANPAEVPRETVSADSAVEIHARDLKTIMPLAKEGDPIRRVVIEHKPTGKRFEGEAGTLEEAKAIAMAALRKGVGA